MLVFVCMFVYINRKTLTCIMYEASHIQKYEESIIHGYLHALYALLDKYLAHGPPHTTYTAYVA